MCVEIYALCDPDGVVRYVGKSGNSVDRLVFHLTDARHSKDRAHKLCWLRKCLRQGHKPGLLIIEECEEAVWEERERYWIAEYRRRGAKLTNGTDGGDGQTRITPEMRTRMVAGLRSPEGRKACSARGIPAEVRRKISATLKGRIVSKGVGEKISFALKGRKKPPRSDSHNEALRQAARKQWEGLSPEQRQRQLAAAHMERK